MIVLLVWIISISILLFVLIYLYANYMFGYWRRCGVPFLSPKFPLGNNDCIGFEAMSYGIETVQWYNAIKIRGLKYAGVWSWLNPLLLITDIDYIKDVLIKNFPHFTDRDFYHSPKNDPSSETLFVFEQENWKSLRHKLTTAFTTTKIRIMFTAIKKYTKPMLQFLEEPARLNKDVDILEIVSSFTTDVTGGIAFGLEYNSFKSKEQEFRKMGKEIFRPTLTSMANIILSRMCPVLAQKLGVTNMPVQVKNFFTNVVIENLKFRKENNIKTNDIMQILIDYSKENQNFSFSDIVGNVLGTFIAGYDTSASTMNMALYELSRNPEIQEKVRAEILSELHKNEGESMYESLRNMTYLRQVIDETLRMYPVVQNIARICVKPYRFSGTDFTIPKGMTVLIPALAISRDPQYYQDPEKFEPERFSVENKAKRNPLTYLAFGEGPRNCIGKRVGIMQVSIGLIELLKTFRFKISSNTKMPLTLKPGLFLMKTNETLYLRVEKL